MHVNKLKIKGSYVGIVIKVRNQVASYVCSQEIAGYPPYRQHWLLFVSVHANNSSWVVISMHAQVNLKDLIPTLACLCCL